jgi:hypothetical protein
MLHALSHAKKNLSFLDDLRLLLLESNAVSWLLLKLINKPTVRIVLADVYVHFSSTNNSYIVVHCLRELTNP